MTIREKILRNYNLIETKLYMNKHWFYYEVLIFFLYGSEKDGIWSVVFSTNKIESWKSLILLKVASSTIKRWWQTVQEKFNIIGPHNCFSLLWNYRIILQQMWLDCYFNAAGIEWFITRWVMQAQVSL